MEFRQVKLRSCFRGDEYGVSSVVFDPQEELLWAATFGVSRTSRMRDWSRYNDVIVKRLA